MKLILAIDPGDVTSGVVLYDPAARAIRQGKAFGAAANPWILEVLGKQPTDSTILIIETFRPRGQPMFAQLIDTAIWTGRFIQRWAMRGGEWSLLVREAVKHAICGRPNVGDPNVRAALIDQWGGQQRAIGKKASPGPLYGVTGDAWQALALAVAWADGTRPPQQNVAAGALPPGNEPAVATPPPRRARKDPARDPVPRNRGPRSRTARRSSQRA